MKKAALLFLMVISVVCILYLKDADADTVLIKPSRKSMVMEQLVQDTKEVILEEEELNPTEAEEISKKTESGDGNLVINEPKEGSSLAFFGLSLEEQKVYNEILTLLLALDKQTVLSSCDRAQIDKVFQCVMLDHPEIFYVDGYKYTWYKDGDTVTKIEFTGNYVYSEEEISERQEKIAAAVTEILAGMPDTEDEYLIVKYFYEELVADTEYDSDGMDNQNICSVFINKKSVCQGYAKAFQYLLHQAGMEAGLVKGTVKDNGSHAWNLVSVNGNWYYVDVTWGDASYRLSDGMEEKEVNGADFVNYDYLCVTTAQLEKTHVIQMPVPLPQCDSVTDNYYVREGLYFTEYNEERIAALFANAIEKELTFVTLKCSDDIVFHKICSELIAEQKVFSYVSASDGSIAYTDNKEQGSITFWL